ncbi:MAG TPA: succinylglutamate desuccinylase/aspartoacylase family protein [Microvirga sp.]|jgi:predicted deacylase
MKTEQISLAPLAPGADLTLTVHRFGTAGARPKVYIQAALHADEIPGMLTAHHLRERLQKLEAEGRVRGEIVLVPSANPIGLSQRVLSNAIGRFDLADGLNFNRGFPYLVPNVAERVKDKLGSDEAANVRAVREALKAELDASPARTPAEHLKKALVGLAIDADWVFDIHCDSEAVMHLYTLTPSAEAFEPLSAFLGAEAMLLATESGDDPFDEACSRPWFDLKERFPEKAIPIACHATTLELRGEADVSHELAVRDAGAILDFLTLRGVLAGDPPAMPAARCKPTPLAASEPIEAPATGIIAFHRAAGERVKAGDRIADIVDPITGVVTPVETTSDGVLYARVLVRFIGSGRRIGKVAGTSVKRTGKLLSP